MASITDFLFEGKPPKSTTTYGETIENIPKWMSDYTQGLIAKANAAAAEPYIPYGGPRVAGFSPTEQEAFGLAEENVGSYQPYLESGAGGVRGALDAFGEEYDPLGAAEGDLNRGTEEFPDAVGRYMDPYIQNVLDRNASLAGRQLTEEFLPGLQRSFAGAGQLGSRGGTGSMEDIGVRGVRGITENLNEQNLAALSGAYGQAGELFGADRGRDIQAGEIRGGLEEAGGRLGYQQGQGFLDAAGRAGDLGELASRLGYTDAGALESIGRQERDLAQKGLDTAYGDFREQRDLPFERLGFMSDIIRGLPYSRQTQSRDYGPASTYQPSGLSQIAGAYATYKGLSGRARGGYIDHDTGEYVDDGMDGGLAMVGKR